MAEKVCTSDSSLSEVVGVRSLAKCFRKLDSKFDMLSQALAADTGEGFDCADPTFDSFLNSSAVTYFSPTKAAVLFNSSRLPQSVSLIGLGSGQMPDQVIPVTSKLALQRLPCQAPGVIGSALDWLARCRYTVTW